MRAVVIGLAFFGLGACGRSAEHEQQFDIAINSGTYSDVCTAARRAADSALQNGDQAEFRRWSLTRDIYCSTAQRDPEGRPSTQAAEDAAAAAENRRAIAAMRNSADPSEREVGRVLSGERNSPPPRR